MRQQLAQPELAARLLPLLLRRVRLRAKRLDRRPQLGDAAPVVASVLMIGGRHSPGGVRLQRQVRLHRRHEPIGAVAIGLVDDEDVGDLHDAGLERLHFVAGARHEDHERHVGRADDVDFVLADADRLDDDERLARPRRAPARRRVVARARPPSCPRVAMLRMKTSGSAKCACMRTRSPRIAPPVNGLVGSTAMTPTVSPLRRAFRRQPIDERALAGAGRAGDADQIGAAGAREDRRDQRPPRRALRLR